ncbi:putative membrane protein (plasmid) [Pseudomonas syringae pv. avii]|uniref:Membrane protein n=1 Tax=Pseudomonas syringae pv. avii TaxID=663959 RepID=A0ABY1UGL3_PSESX|nr:putative membrane protein [Pseudomonas syringae pv. avii]
MESVSGCLWNECLDQRGISVRMSVDWVSGWSWNPQPSVTKPLFSSSPKVIAMHQTGFTAFTFIVSVLFSRTRKWASFYSLGPAF